MLALPFAAVSRQAGDGARTFLGRRLPLSEADLARTERGEPVVHTLDADDPREIAILGVVYLRIAPARYVERLAGIAAFKKEEAAVLQIGTVSEPAQPGDLAGLTLAPSDVSSLADCTVGDCDVQLSAAAIERFRREVDWNSPHAENDANALMRRLLAESAEHYRARGAAGLMEYADRSERVSLAREFRDLVADDIGVLSQFPALHRYLLEYPAVDVSRTRDLIYWSKEDLGPRVVVSLTHLVIHQTGGGSAVEYAVASKQIYGSHYFDASLGLTLLLPDRKDGREAVYLVYLNRSRLDALGGFFGSIKRRVVRSKARGAMEEYLGRLKTRLERESRITNHLVTNRHFKD
jgi:hypothetical protein